MNPNCSRPSQNSRSANLGVEAIPCDVSHTADCQNLIAKTIGKFGKIDTCICNAGTDIIKPATDYSEEEWDKILDVNLRGAYMCAKIRRHRNDPGAAREILS